jgi:dihydrofolate synthase/folylpolyglutamate synthase
MMQRSLQEWLDYQLRTHPQSIALGLERVAEVWRRLGARRPAPCVITVGGTNGKGTTVAMLEAMLLAAGHHVGAFTSPHLIRYNERMRLDRRDVEDTAWVEVFHRIERARGEIPLTYFEFGTLAALELMADAGVGVALLEVGLGGRLDAVNIVDADAAIVASIDLDHMEYLGPDRDSIGAEKAGIFRAGRAAVIGERDPPCGLLDAAERIGARVLRIGRDFDIQSEHLPGILRWHMDDVTLDLPAEALDAPGRIDNAASALACLRALRGWLHWPAQDYALGLATLALPARVQRIAGPPEIIVDVAHNPHAARALAAWLRAHPPRGHTLAVFSALADKDIAGIAAALGPLVDRWHLCALADAGNRSLDAEEVERRLLVGWPPAQCVRHADPPTALAAARREARDGDRILAFGSFHLAGSVLDVVGKV